MKARLALAILMMSASLAAAQEKMTDQLRKAIVEEEGNQNLDKAIQAYQSILAQYDEERQTAATALFHLADCYRKLGKKDQAIAAYRRVVKEFQDQTKLANTSRTYLTKTYGLSEAPAAVPANKPDSDARRRYREILLAEIALMTGQIESLQKRVEIGGISPGGPEMTGAKLQLLELQRTLAAFDAGALPIPKDINK